jgi:chromosome segregation ATPase
MIDETTSHSTSLPKDGNQVAGYNSRLLIALFVGITFSLPVMAKLYKWVDEKGITHYGETIPPEYADRDRAELNKSGRTVKVIEVPTAAERKAQKEADEKKRADEKAAIERKRRDMTLTNTYSNVNEIDLARNRSLQQVNARINNHTSQLKMASDNLLALQKESEDYTMANKQIPSTLQDDLKDTQDRVDRLQKNLDKSLAEKAAVEARYDADKTRYQELTGR